MPVNRKTPFKNFFRKNFRRLEGFIFYLKSFLSPRQFIYLACFLVGVSSALAVIVLKTFAHWVYVFAQYMDSILHLPYSNSTLPIIGIVLTAFVVKKALDGFIEKGTSQIMYAVAKKSGIMPKKQMYAQIITSSLTVGMGGSAGLESPITITGAAFGSNFAQNYRLSYKDRTLLLACGVAAGIAAAFNAPIAGVLFAIEVVLMDVSITAFIPIMISSATGAIVSAILLKDEILFTFSKQLNFDYHNLPFYILLGVVSGFVSINYARTFRNIEHHFEKSRLKPIRKALYGAFILAILIFFFPTLFGEGYESIKMLANTNPQQILENTVLQNFKDNIWILLLFVGATMFIKVYATSITIGSGGNGGNFAPSLFVGSYLGFVVATFFNQVGFKLPVINFTMVGMAGILSGLFHAPLTAIFLIAEITSGYSLMVPLMVVSSISFAISKRYEPYSFDIKNLAAKGDVFTDDRDRNILSGITPYNLIQTNIQTLKLSNSLEELIQKLSNYNQSVFPVVNDKNELIGMVNFEEIRPYLFNNYKVKFTPLQDIMRPPKEQVNYDETADSIMDKFDRSQEDFLPVLKNNQVIGLLSKTAILEAYRVRLKNMIIE
ncbi:chloride channel protein [Flavobacterium piscinae]|uniref:Chloride channel protein n=1 Tax=Flavobacterium piscinae TaxID=2506424 RepID=A0A4V1N4K7_9FLAO|nr:chloride channel protein [Flavobacterium piscinae]RXR32506.1 chloride channel protein [Flavobacterium piscinae]